MKYLSPLAVAVMGLLTERPMHPYEVSFTMRQRCLDRHIKLNFGSLYHTFEQLLRAGFLESTDTERAGRRPERTVYVLTEAGRRRFFDRLSKLVAVPNAVFSDFEAGLAFLHQLEAGEAAELLRKRASALRAEVASTDAVMADLAARGLSRLCLIEVEMAQAMRRSQAEWAVRTARQIESGELEWFAGLIPRLEVKPA